MRTGDTVFHRPSGETWVVSWADKTEIIPCGWPETFARVSDCDLLSACSDEEHWAMVEKVAAAGSSTRAYRCWYMMEQKREGECLAMMHL
jgi:hypothetical protein